MKKLISVSLLFISLITAVGCSRTTQLSFLVEGDSQMNNGGNFVIVRIYQLTNDTNFSTADFATFWGDDDAQLGGELVAGTKQQISLFPPRPQELANSQSLQLEVSDETRFIGFAAKLYSPDGDQWRQLYEVERLEKSLVTVSVKENHIVVDLKRN